MSLFISGQYEFLNGILIGRIKIWVRKINITICISIFLPNIGANCTCCEVCRLRTHSNNPQRASKNKIGTEYSNGYEVGRLRTAITNTSGSGGEFENFLEENYFDLHYQVHPDAKPINLGLRHLWRLAVDHPKQQVLPCIHRAPIENDGEYGLLLIC